jgi:predicted RNase H-like HicB family nuclease
LSEKKCWLREISRDVQADDLGKALGEISRTHHLLFRAIYDTFSAMKFSTVIDRDEDGVWVIECPSIPGCVSQGRTKADAIKNIAQAIALCLEVRAERGLPLTVETQQVEVTV